MCTKPVAAANMAWTMLVTFELTIVYVRALSSNNWLVVSNAALQSMKVTTACLPSQRTISINHLRADTLSLHHRAGLNPAWVPPAPPSANALRWPSAACVSGRGSRSYGSSPCRHEGPSCAACWIPPRQFARDTVRVPHHAAHAEEFIRSVHGPSVGFYGHVVTRRRFATA